METLLKDLRYGFRGLLRRPGFTGIAVLTLALGIGANTAIFSVVNAVLLRPLPFKDPDRVVMLWGFLPRLAQSHDRLPSSSGNFTSLQKDNHVFENLAAFRNWSWQSTGAGEPEQLQGVRVSADFFSAVGATPMLGHAFTSEQDTAGAAPVAIISHGLWQRQFGSDPNVVGKSITLTGENVMVIGVMPAGFQFPGGANMIPGLQFALQNDVWMPLALTEKQKTDNSTLNLAVIGRLKPGVSLGQAELETRTIEKSQPLATIGYTINLVSLHKQMAGGIQQILLVLLATVAFVLLIACANVANLMLARGAARQKEFAVRAALGAGRLQLIRQLLTESLLLSLVGGVIGFLVALWGNTLLISLIPKNVPRVHEIGIDTRILAFTLLVSFVTGILFGLVPAWQVSKLDLNESLKDGNRGTTSGGRQQRVRSLLVVSEVALAIVLLIGATLLTKSFSRLLNTNPGFDPANVLTMDVVLPTQPPSRYANDAEQISFFQQAIDHVKTLPGVEEAGAILSLPLTGAADSTNLIIEGRPAPARGQGPEADYTTVTSSFFQTLRIPLVRGRQFNAQDTKDAPGVIVINEALARKYFPNEDPIGKRFTVGFEKKPREIVGIVGSIKQAALNAEVRPAMYLPHPQAAPGAMTLVVRTAGDPRTIAPAVREQVRALDKDVPVARVGTMEEVLAVSVAPQKFSMLLVGLFAIVALVLAVVGIYGVMAYSVTQRFHEMGVRIALGASSNDVLKLILKNGMTLTAAGVALGLGGAFALTRFMSALLFGVTATDVTTFAGVSLALLFVACVACYVPARRATKVDPLVALRCE